MAFLFRVRVLAVRDATCHTEWISVPGQEPLAAKSRSAALIALSEASLQSSVQPNPLRDALGEASLTDPNWHRENLGRFVLRTRASDDRPASKGCEEAWEDAEITEQEAKRRQWEEADRRGTTPSAEALAEARSVALKRWRAVWELCHRHRLEIEVADPRWLAHLKEGDIYGTTAFDVWREG